MLELQASFGTRSVKLVIVEAPVVCEISYNTRSNENNYSDEKVEAESPKPKKKSIWPGKVKTPEEKPEIKEKPKKSSWKPWKSKSKDKKKKAKRTCLSFEMQTECSNFD